MTVRLVRRQFLSLIRNAYILIITSLLTMVMEVTGQGQPLLSLDRAITIGLQQNYQILIDSNNVRSSALSNSPGNAGFLPRLDLIGDVSYSGQNINQVFSTGTEINTDKVSNESQSAGAYLTWTLFDGFNMFATARFLKLQEDQARSTSKENVQILVANIINTYYDVVQQKLLLELTDSSLKYYDIALSTSKNFQLNGRGTRQQVLQAQIDRNAQQALRLARKNSLEVAKANLNNLLQRNPEIAFDVTDSILLIPDFSPDTSELFLRQHNPSLLIAHRNVDVHTSIMQQMRSLYFPQLDLNASYVYNNSTSDASFFLKNQNTGWNAGFTLSWNLFDGFNTRNAVAISKINTENARLEYRQLLSETNTLINTGWKSYKTALDAMLLLRENLDLSHENLLLATEQYKLLAIIQVDLQRAHKSFDDASAAYVAALYEVKKAETNLLLLNGSLVR